MQNLSFRRISKPVCVCSVIQVSLLCLDGQRKRQHSRPTSTLRIQNLQKKTLVWPQKQLFFCHDYVSTQLCLTLHF